MLKSNVCAEQVQLQEVAVCFGGQLMRGNRAQKVNASNYQAFDSPTYHKLALLGVEVDWQPSYLLKVRCFQEFKQATAENAIDGKYSH